MLQSETTCGPNQVVTKGQTDTIKDEKEIQIPMTEATPLLTTIDRIVPIDPTVHPETIHGPTVHRTPVVEADLLEDVAVEETRVDLDNFFL